MPGFPGSLLGSGAGPVAPGADAVQVILIARCFLLLGLVCLPKSR